jgi:hypothetical protein
MDVTDRVRTARCSPAFIGKGLKFKVYIVLFTFGLAIFK